jgi:hypothetical protein
MILMQILPGVLKELTKHVPTVFFQLVDWGQIASEVPKLTKKLLQKEGYVEFLNKQKDFLLPLGLSWSANVLDERPQKVSRDTGIKWLEIYFAQIYSPHGLFLDLRPQNFDPSQTPLHWHPTGLWSKFEESFRLGMIKVYDGFYLGDEKLYYEGLVEVGLMAPEWSDEDKKRLGDLFKEQFGDANTKEVLFTLSQFNKSMTKTFQFILEKKRQMSVDFLYLGIYLVTLYAALEKTGEPLPVKDIYLRIRKNFPHA